MGSRFPFAALAGDGDAEAGWWRRWRRPLSPGYVWVFDRETGKPLFPVEYRKCAAVVGRWRSVGRNSRCRSSPRPLHASAHRGHADPRTPEAHAAALERFRKLLSAAVRAAQFRNGTIMFPGFDGGAEWGGAAFDPASGLLYVNANEMAWILRLMERPANPTG